MSSDELLEIESLELKFPLELNKQISCPLPLSNKTDRRVAFKVKTTNPKKYCVRPNNGIVDPGATCDVTVTMQAQREAPADLQCKDKFLVQCVGLDPGIEATEITPEMFAKESGNVVEEWKLRVVYLPPAQTTSPVATETAEAYSYDPSVSESEGSLANPDLVPAPGLPSETGERSSEVPSIVSKLTDEKNYALEQRTKLLRELELLRREASRKSSGGFSFTVVLIVAVLGILLGYFLKK